MHESVGVGLVPVLALALVAWGLAAARLERWNVSGPIAFVALGLLLGIGPEPILTLSAEAEVVLVLVEITLAIVLFGDAATVPLRRLEGDAGPPARLLVVGLPLTIGLGTLAAKAMLPDLSWWLCAVIGAAVAPTDAALGAAIVEDERVPRRIRRLLNVESGLNDGIATPFVNCFLVAAVVGTTLERGSVVGALGDLAVGVLVGVAVGALSGRGFERALAAGWAERGFVPVATAAVAVASYTVAVGIGANGFVAAFVAGLAHRAAHRGDPMERALEFTHQAGTTLSLSVWFLFGIVVASLIDDLTWGEVGFALLALTVVRMVPVAIALLGSGFDRATVGIVGWFGPRGLASVVFALLALEALGPTDAEPVVLAIAATVLLSVLLHGASAGPLAGRYGATHPGSTRGPDGERSGSSA